MTKQTVSGTKRQLAKRERNRADYERLKASQEAVLLRLGSGEKRILDEAASNAGLSRSAFAQLYLVPIAAALTVERLEILTTITWKRKIALSTAIAVLIDLQTNELSGGAIEPESQEDIALAFDELFAVTSLSSDDIERPAL
jgi:hypothetical protein